MYSGVVQTIPLQNRVDPWGALHSTPARGTLMGNRGQLHAGRDIIRPWKSKAWVTCVLSFGQRKQTLFAPGHYTQLFFLDEATAFSAGHRPCGECQSKRYREFKKHWCAANHQPASIAAKNWDDLLHAERVGAERTKTTHRSNVRELPVGTMFAHAGHAYIVLDDAVRPWSFTGYGAPEFLVGAAEVDVLTPRSVVAAFKGGFRPAISDNVA
jgi:hypothetical protein